MTYKELTDDVTALGFEGYVSNKEALLCAVRRALRTIFTEKEARGSFTFYQNPTDPDRIIPDFIHTGRGVEEFFSNERAISFKSSGVGECIISDDAGARTIPLSEGGAVQREHLFGNARITFVGDFCYSVFDIALYDRLFGPDKSDIPHPSSSCEYNLKQLISDFMSALTPPTDEGGNEIHGATICGEKLKLPTSYVGKVSISYKRAPVLPNGKEDEVIDLPLSCEHLLPLLVAAYFWLDDDEDKAAYYMSLYREGMQNNKRYVRGMVDTSYSDVIGWA